MPLLRQPLGHVITVLSSIVANWHHAKCALCPDKSFIAPTWFARKRKRKTKFRNVFSLYILILKEKKKPTFPTFNVRYILFLNAFLKRPKHSPNARNFTLISLLKMLFATLRYKIFARQKIKFLRNTKLRQQKFPFFYLKWFFFVLNFKIL